MIPGARPRRSDPPSRAHSPQGIPASHCLSDGHARPDPERDERIEEIATAQDMDQVRFAPNQTLGADVVGWSMAKRLRTELGPGCIRDGRIESTTRSWAHPPRRPRCPIHQPSVRSTLSPGRQAGIAPSMGSVGDCFDNAMAGPFFASLKCELIGRSRWRRTPKPEW
jgi:hypothetical protein